MAITRLSLRQMSNKFLNVRGRTGVVVVDPFCLGLTISSIQRSWEFSIINSWVLVR